MINQYLKENRAYFYAVFRILVGIMFFFHGAQKFGWLGGGTMFTSLWPMGLAGIIEVLVGIALVLGVWVNWAAILGGVQMLVAYFWMHTPKSLYFVDGKGELALMYLASFLVLAAFGAGTKWTLQQSE